MFFCAGNYAPGSGNLRVFLRFGWTFALSGRDRFSALGNALEVIPDRLVFGKTEFFVRSVPHAFDAPGRYAHKTGDFLRAVVLFYQHAEMQVSFVCVRLKSMCIVQSMLTSWSAAISPFMISGIIRLNLVIWSLFAWLAKEVPL